METVEKNEYPLYPELNPIGNEEAKVLMDKFKANAKKIIDELLADLYVDLLPEIESDSWMNFRNKIMDGFRNYNNRHIQNRYDFKKIRQEIYKEYREDIIKDLDQDNLEKIESLEKEIKRLNEILYPKPAY